MSRQVILALTGGGHVDFGPGIKALIEGAKEREYGIFGSLYGWKGVQRAAEGDGHIVDLAGVSQKELKKMEYVGASPIFSSRTKPNLNMVERGLRRYGITHVVAFGGDDTMGVFEDAIGWPKTMDNNHGPGSDKDDLSPGTYFTVGYPTALQRAAEQTLWSLANAQTNSTVHIVVPFSRKQDFMPLGAAAYGRADFMVPGELECDFETFYQKLQQARERNADTYHCEPFAVVVMSEGVNRGNETGFFGEYAPEELVEFARKYAKTDPFGNIKFRPELVALMAEETILARAKDETGRRKITKVTSRAPTYMLRDGPGIPIDQRMGAELAEKCLDLVAENEFGQMATVRWDDKINDFTTDSVPIPEASKERYVKETGFFDPDSWTATDKFFSYACRFMGGPPERRDYLFDAGKYKKAMPVE